MVVDWPAFADLAEQAGSMASHACGRSISIGGDYAIIRNAYSAA
jgi:hypothetical protein